MAWSATEAYTRFFRATWETLTSWTCSGGLGAWYGIDWPPEHQAVLELLAGRLRRGERLTPEDRAEAEALVPGGELFELKAVDTLTRALPVPLVCGECGHEEVGTRGWSRACAACVERGRWVQMAGHEMSRRGADPDRGNGASRGRDG